MDKKIKKTDRLATRRTNKLLGDWGEWLIEQKLVAKGYKIIGRKFRKWGGEIDLIAISGSKITFIEVKTRFVSATSSDLYDDLTSIGLNRQKVYRIMKCGRFFKDTYQTKHPEPLNYTDREFDAYILKISPKIDSPNDFSSKSENVLAELDTMEKLNTAFREKRIQVHVQIIKNINLEL